MTDATIQDGPEPKPTRPSVTYVRSKKTKASVVWMDAAAGRIISVGGLFVIATVFAIMLFLIWVAIPLFGTGTASEPHSYKLAEAGGPVISASLDEYASLGLELSSSVHLTAFHAPSGKRVDDIQFDFAGATPSAFARTLQGDDIAYGFADGTVRLGSLAIETRIVDPKTLPQNLVTLPGGDRTEGHAVYLNVAGNQVRRLAPAIGLDAPVQVAPAGTAIRFLDYRVGGTSERPTKIFASVDAAGTARLSAAFALVNMMTGETTTTLENTEVPTGLDVTTIAEILLNTQGDRLLIVTKDGLIHRYDTRNPKASIWPRPRASCPPVSSPQRSHFSTTKIR